MLTSTLVGVVSMLALSCALVGVPVVVMAENVQWIDGTQIINDEGYTLLTARTTMASWTSCRTSIPVATREDV